MRREGEGNLASWVRRLCFKICRLVVWLVQGLFGCALVGQVWRLGHVFPEDDVDIASAVDALWFEKHKASS
jgi:hypothetical protein